MTLLERRARPIALTAAGRELVARLPRLFAAIDDLRTPHGPVAERAEHFRFGLVTSLADRIADDVVSRLRRAFPRVGLTVAVGWTAELVRRIRDDELDAAVIYVADGFVAPPDAELRMIGRVPLVAVGARVRRASARPTRRTPASWVLNASGCSFRDVLTRVLRAAGAPLSIAVEVDGIDRQLSLVAQGVGCGFVPAPVLSRSPVRSRLRLLPLPVPDVSIRVGLLTRELRPALHDVPVEIERHLRRWLHTTSRVLNTAARS